VKTKNKIQLGWLAFTFVILHFFFIFCFALPDGHVPASLKKVSTAYVHPFFEQRWSLFVPCPIMDHKLEVNYFFEDDSTNWISPTSEARRLHANLRFLHYGDLALAESNLLYWVETDLKISDSLGLSNRLHQFEKTWSYKMVKNYVFGNARYLLDKTPVSAKVVCVFTNVKTLVVYRIPLPLFYWDK